ncbi:ankyrin repeat-containing domain protein [Aspergillus cavernicola]|uniref:Ankyrin repeat-containing domain protein n=1 Tax=Aspergillus cavernicola TaxID=176166 RepID=A0ABR4I4K9_9EURO
MTTLSTLPPELHLLICDHLPKEKDLNALTRLTPTLYTLLNPHLYRTHINTHKSAGLLWAAEHGQTHTIQRFVAHGADLTLRTPHGETAFILAAKSGHLGVLREIVVLGGMGGVVVVVEDMYMGEDRNHRTALLHACKNGHGEVVEFILSLDGVDPNHRRNGDGDDETALRVATAGGYEGIVRMLFATGKMDVRDDDLDLEPGSMFYMAIGRDRCGILRMLVEEHGADPGFVGSRGFTPLHHAAISNSHAVVEYLLSLGVDPDPVSDVVSTPFTHAVGGKHLRVMEMLVATGKVNCDFAEGVGRATPLASAAYMGSCEIVEYLLGLGVDINFRDGWGRMPLHRAAAAGHVDVVQLLLRQEGILADVPDFKGQRPLMSAIRNVEVVDLFLQRDDVEWDVADHKGETPLLVAASVNKEAVVEALIARGARIDCKDQHGRTPFAWAKWWQNEEMDRILLDYAKRCRYRQPVSVRDRVLIMEGQSMSPMVAIAEELRGRFEGIST